MKKLYFFLGAFYFFVNANAQAPNIVWEKILGGANYDNAVSVKETTDGGYIYVGSTRSADGDITQNHGSADVWVVKLNVVGEIQWQKTFGGSYDEWGRDILQTSDGFIVLASTTSNDGDVSFNHGNNDYWVLKLTNSGDIEWQRSYGGGSVESPHTIRQTTDGGYIMVGHSASNTFNSDITNPIQDYDVWLVKLNSVGIIEWDKSLGGENEDLGYGVIQTTDGGYIVVGDTNSFSIGSILNNGGTDFYVAKLDVLGNIEWQQMIGGSEDDFPYDVMQLNDGSYVIVGRTFSTDNGITNHGMQDGLVVKLDNTGALQWKKAMGGSGFDGFEKVLKTFDNKIIISGYTNSFDGDTPDNHGGQDGWIVELNADGIVQWSKAYGSVGEEGIIDLEQTVDEGFMIAGIKLPLYGNSVTANSWVVKLDSGQLSTASFNHLDIKLYPNPVKETLSISFTPNIIIKSVSIYNMLGQLVQDNDNETIDVTDLKPGSYFVKIQSDKGSSVGKFIKE